MYCMVEMVFLACVSSACWQAGDKSEEKVFRVEIVTSTPKKAGDAIELSLRGFVDVDGWKISNASLKKAYLNPKKGDCVLHIYFHQSDRKQMTLEYLFKHIDTIRELWDKKSNVYIYIIAD